MNKKQAIEYIVHDLHHELTEEEAAELQRFLEEHPELKEEAQEFRELDREFKHLEENLQAHATKEHRDMSDPLKTRIRELTDESSDHRNKTSPHRRKKRSPTNRIKQRTYGPSWFAAAAAILLAVVIGVFYYNSGSSNNPSQSPAKVIATLDQTASGMVIIRGDQSIQGTPGMKLRQHDQITTPPNTSARFRYEQEQTKIKLKGSCQVELWNKNGNKRIHLKKGTLHGAVDKQSAGRKLVLSHPMGRVEVVGTRFTLSYDQNARLEVTEGMVRFTTKQSGTSVIVAKHEFAEVGPNTELKHGSLNEPESPKNKTLIADAGSDRTISDRNGDGEVKIQLNGSKSEGAISSYRWTKQEDNGQVLGNGPNPTVSLSPGTHNFELTVVGENEQQDMDTVTVTVEKKNQPPVANAGEDRTLVDEDGDGSKTITLNASGSTDEDGEISTYVWKKDDREVATGTTAEVTVSPGRHQFTLIVRDRDGAQDRDRVQVIVNETNRAPVASDVRKRTEEDQPLSVSSPGVLENDQDPNGDPITAELSEEPEHGRVTLQEDGSFRYVPDENTNGEDEFQYVVSDGKGKKDTGTVYINVQPVSDPPIADAGEDRTLRATNHDRVEVNLDASESTDPDGDIEEYTWKLNGKHIATGATATGKLPPGEHNIQLTVTDQEENSDTDSLTITVHGH